MAKNKGKYKSIRLTGLFKTKKKGMYTGSARAEEVAKLAKLIKKMDGDELTFFLFRCDDDNKAIFNLLVDEKQEFDKGKGKKKGKHRDEEPDDDDDDDDDKDDDDDDDDIPF